MIDISTALQNILKAVYGRDVRESIHDAIYQINANANEAIDLAQIKFGTAVNSPTDPISGFTENSVYLNVNTGIMWRLEGGSWVKKGTFKSIDSISLSGTSGLIDTYTITFTDGSTSNYNVKNGKDGKSITGITKTSTSGNVDHYDVNLSDGTTTSGFDVTNGTDGTNGKSIANISLASTSGNVKNYDVFLDDGTKTPTGFSVEDGASSYLHIRYSSSFDGTGMVTTPTDATVYIGILVSTSSVAPTNPSLYNWVRFIGKSGTGSGDMLATDYATKYPNTVDKAAALYDGTDEILANQLMKKSVYDADDDGVVDLAKNANKALNANNAEVADNATHALMSEKAWGLESSDGTYSVSAKEANDMYDCFHKEGADLKLSDNALSSATTTKLSKVDTTDNLSVELEKKIDKPASATDGQVLTYNGTSNEWEAQNAKGGAGKQVKSCEYAIERWLRFDPSNRKGLIIKAGTSIRNSQGNYIDFDSDTSVDLTSVITTAGEDYYVYMLDDGSITASLTSATAPYNSVRIGRFHSLCVAVGTCTMIVPPSGIAVGSNYLVKSYRQDEDLDFFNLYNKSVTATGTNNETLAHPLSGFEAGAILPESVMCLSFYSGSLFDDGQVYDKDIDAFIDIYLQSGIGLNTRSKYGATHTVSRTQGNHMVDMRQVGKKLLSDGEFESASIGSNQATNIQGSADKGTVGGHVDTANRRMISAIGAEEMCGYLWQWTRDVSSTGGSSWATTDGNGSFGQEYGTPYVLRAGGAWDNGSNCGSRSRSSNHVRSGVSAAIGGRGLSRVVRGV